MGPITAAGVRQTRWRLHAHKLLLLFPSLRAGRSAPSRNAGPWHLSRCTHPAALPPVQTAHPISKLQHTCQVAGCGGCHTGVEGAGHGIPQTAAICQLLQRRPGGEEAGSRKAEGSGSAAALLCSPQTLAGCRLPSGRDARVNRRGAHGRAGELATFTHTARHLASWHAATCGGSEPGNQCDTSKQQGCGARGARACLERVGDRRGHGHEAAADGLPQEEGVHPLDKAACKEGGGCGFFFIFFWGGGAVDDQFIS